MHSLIAVGRQAKNGVNTADADADNMELFYLDRPTSENADSGLLSAADKAKTLADTFSKVLGEELDNVVSDGYIITTDSGVGYEIEIQKAYKGIGIQNVFSTNADDTLFVKGNALMTYSMQTYTDLDANFGPEYYIGCNAFKVAKAEKIDKMLSFKGACDLLEEILRTRSIYSLMTSSLCMNLVARVPKSAKVRIIYAVRQSGIYYRR